MRESRMRTNAVVRPVSRWLLVVSLLGVVVVGAVPAAFASCIVPFEPVELVTGRLAGESVEERHHVNLGQVLGVAELETLRVWDAIPEWTAASATVVTRYWGVPPPDQRLDMDDRFNAKVHGGHYTGPSATETGISCDPSEARALGSREYVAVFEVSEFIPIESGLTAEEEAILTQFLGEPTIVDSPALPAEHPNTNTQPPTTSNSTMPWILLSFGAVALGGIFVWWLLRVRSDA